MYKIRNFDIEEKTKYIKPNSLYNSVMKNMKKSKVYNDLVEESKSYKINKAEAKSFTDYKVNHENSKKVLEEVYSNPLDFSKKIFAKINKAQKKILEKLN